MFFNGPKPIFYFNQHIIKTNILTKTNEYWASNVTSTVLTRFFYFWHSDLAFDPAWPSFELGRDIIRTHFLTKFDEDRTIKVASRVFTRRIVDDKRRTTDDGQKAISMAHHDHVVLRWAKSTETNNFWFQCPMNKSIAPQFFTWFIKAKGKIYMNKLGIFTKKTLYNSCVVILFGNLIESSMQNYRNLSFTSFAWTILPKVKYFSMQKYRKSQKH